DPKDKFGVETRVRKLGKKLPDGKGDSCEFFKLRGSALKQSAKILADVNKVLLEEAIDALNCAIGTKSDGRLSFESVFLPKDDPYGAFRCSERNEKPVRHSSTENDICEKQQHWDLKYSFLQK